MSLIFEFLILLLFACFAGYVIYSNHFKKKSTPSKNFEEVPSPDDVDPSENSEEVPSPDDIEIKAQKIDGLPGNWLSLGKNQLGTEIYFGLDTVSRVPAANMNIGMFDRVLTNPKAINEEGDKSAIITRVVDFNNNCFKETKYKMFKKPFCKGKGEEFEFKLDELNWTPIVENSWDWLFNQMVKDVGLTIGGKKVGKNS